MTPRSWEHWKERYESSGHEVIAPPWPGLEVEVEALRADPTPLAGLGFKKVTDHFERIIRELDRPPIIMGHSMGGAVTQLLIDRGCGAAAVGIAPATVKGVYDLPLSTIRASGAVLAQPVQPRQGDADHEEAVPLQLRQHAEPRGVGRALGALRRAGGRPRCCSTSRPATSAATRRRRWTSRSPTARRISRSRSRRTTSCPPKAARHNTEKYKTRHRRVHDLPGPAALPRRVRLGGGRGLRAPVGDGAFAHARSGAGGGLGLAVVTCAASA